MPLVEVSNLAVTFGSRGEVVRAVDGVSFEIEAGTAFGLVGESGSGKSVTALSLVGLTPPGARIGADRLLVAETDVAKASPADLRDLLRDRVGLVFQNPQTALNPRLTVGQQMVEALGREPSARAERIDLALSLLERVGIENPLSRLTQFPHELSGGLAQRVVIAMSLARRARLLIADEPTTALDTRIQAQILDLLDELRDSLELAVLLISHDLGVVAERTDRIAVMRRGRIVESGRTASVLTAPAHPYTTALLDVIPDPRVAVAGAAEGASYDDTGVRLLPPRAFSADDGPREALVTVTAVSKSFDRKPGRSRRLALDDVSLTIEAGDSVGLVGESGSGKTTLAKIIAGLERATAGNVSLSPELGRKTGKRRAPSLIQYVFQDTGSSLNPHLRVRDIVGEFLEGKIPGRRRRYARVAELLAEVELPEEYLERYPRQLSGGQRQRVGIARALAADPVLLVADEPVSALDVSVQATVINLLNRLRESRGLTSLIISHDIGVISYLCNRIVVLRDGRLQEAGRTDDVVLRPRSEYARELLAAVPTLVGIRNDELAVARTGSTR